MRKIIVLSLVVFIYFISCNPLDTGLNQDSRTPETEDLPLAVMNNPVDWTEPPVEDFTELRRAFLQTFDMENNVDIADRGLRPVLMDRAEPGFRATIPVWNESRSFADGSIADYPEPGFTTNYTVQSEGSNIYRIGSTSLYPSSNDLVDRYIEEYFVKDVDPVGSWGTEDFIVDASGAADPLYREKMEIHFDDGTVRYEKIVKILGSSTVEAGFAPFDINASLSYPDFAYPDSDPAAQYSSVVIYSQDINVGHDYWFWEGTITGALLGVRFYTEHFTDDGAYYKGTTAAYERAVETYTTGGGDLVKQLDDVYNGSEHTTLAESVLRKEVVFGVENGVPASNALGANTVMRTHVVDTAGAADADFLLQLLNDDAAVFTDWDGAPYHVPSGTDADEIISAIPEAEVVVNLYADNPDGSDLPLLVDSWPSNSDLAALYRSIETGVVDVGGVDPTDETVDITAGDLPNGGAGQTLLMNDIGVADFDSEMGYKVAIPADDSSITPSTEGSVEAWVYVDKHENFAGIVHKGIEHDFSDEAYSLQFWGRNGNVAFGIARQDPYRYKLVTSSFRLNKRKSYYLVGTWDSQDVHIHIYYDDRWGNPQHRFYSVANSLTPPEPSLPGGPLVIGSQYLEGYGRDGFYGFDGKINGVVVSTYAKEAAELEAFYNANKDKVVYW